MDQEVEAVLEKIRLLRTRKGMSILELANRSNVSHSYVYYVETKKKVPTLTVLCRMAKALDVRMKDLFEDEPS
jgi:transcriptional regulator with XRE-family HTH domain